MKFCDTLTILDLTEVIFFQLLVGFNISIQKTSVVEYATPFTDSQNACAVSI